MKDLCACLNLLKIRAQLAQYCVSDMGKALCEALNPSNRIEDVLRMQQETDEAHSLLAYLGGTPMIPFSDVHASLHLAQIGSFAFAARVAGYRRLPSGLQSGAGCDCDR